MAHRFVAPTITLAAVLFAVPFIAHAENAANDSPRHGSGEPAEKAPVSEDELRKRFLELYQSAKGPVARAETVRMLKGVTEQASLRLITGMLGDSSDEVRQAACATMAGTPDSEGFFVKPLMGTLMDHSETVRVAAADAISRATIRGDAVKALMLALITAIDQTDRNDAVLSASSIHAYDKALERLTGERSKERTSVGLSSFWNSYWHNHEDLLRAADKKLLEKETAPRPSNLPPDTLDKK